MDLDYLKLDRNLYRKDSRYQDTDINTATYYADSPGGETSNVATEIAEGTIIQSSIWRTSNGDSRIELMPDDTLTSYRNDSVGFRLEPGLVISNNPIMYFGAQMPVVYGGYFDYPTNTLTRLPAGWTATIIIGGGGEVEVQITHNLNDPNLNITVTPISVHSRPMVQTVDPNFFIISQQISVYSGGGLYLGEDNTFMTSFYFTITRYIV